MQATQPVYLTLAETKSYPRRRVGWFAGPKDGHADHRMGTMRIVLEKCKKPGDSTEVDEYGVEEERDRHHPAGVRSFLLKNDTDAGQPDVYRCVVGSDARGLVHDRCTCKAGTVGRRCKHLDALDRLIEEWVI